MALTKVVDGRVVEMSADEEAAILAEWDSGDPVKQPGPDYRAKRKAAYIAELGKVPKTTFEDTVGDVLDILITQVEAMRSAAGVKATDEFAARLQTIAAIKARFPKS